MSEGTPHPCLPPSATESLADARHRRSGGRGKEIKLAVMVSGGGSNLEAVLQAAEKGDLPGIQVCLVLSSRPDAFALERARKHRIDAQVIDPHAFTTDRAFQDAMVKTLKDYQIDVVCLAGYLKKLGRPMLDYFGGRILNIHPALLPKFGGPGMYGLRVHEAVLKSGEKETGCTIHVVDDEFDHGPILAQTRVPVLPHDTPEHLAKRVLEQEHQLYPRVIRQFCDKLRGEGTG